MYVFCATVYADTLLLEITGIWVLPAGQLDDTVLNDSSESPQLRTTISTETVHVLQCR